MTEQNENPQAPTPQQPQQFAAPPQGYAYPQQFAGYPQQPYGMQGAQVQAPPAQYPHNFVPPQPQLPPLPQYPTYPAQPQAQPQAQHSPEEGHIPKRLAAIEAYKHLRTMRTMGFALLISPFLVGIAGVFHPYAGIGVSALAAFGSIFFIYRAQGEMKRLESKYAIDPKAIN